MKVRIAVKRGTGNSHLSKSAQAFSMTQWITADEHTASTLHSLFPEQAVIESHHQSALDLVLDRDQTIVAVMPSHGRGQGQSALAVFRWNRLPEPVLAPPLAPDIRAGGILGLRDEPIFEEEEDTKKKSWWKRFWDR